MKFLLAAIVGCCLFLAIQASKLSDREGYQFEARERLGHFLPFPFTPLYESYAAAFVRPGTGRPNDDYRNYQPSGDECITFFSSYITNDYKIEDTEKIVLLDACLGYLYTSDPEDIEEDSKRSEYIKGNLGVYKSDAKLKALYDGTKLNSFSSEAQFCVGNLLLNSILVKAQFPQNTCNKEWLEVFNNFADCHKTIPAEARETDTYISLIYQLVKARGKQCFDEQLHTLNQAVRGTYVNSFDHLNNVAQGTFSAKYKELGKRLQPKQITKVLEAVAPPSVEKNWLRISSKSDINNRAVAVLLQSVVNEVEPLENEILFAKKKQVRESRIEIFTSNLATAATKAVDLAKKSPDADGSGRYRNWVDSLCNFFRHSDDKRMFDYVTPFAAMVKMLDYPEIFDISQREFVKKVLTNGWETAPLYLSVYSCNVMSFTHGAIKTQPQNTTPSYIVKMAKNTESMIRWPTMGFE